MKKILLSLLILIFSVIVFCPFLSKSQAWTERGEDNNTQNIALLVFQLHNEADTLYNSLTSRYAKGILIQTSHPQKVNYQLSKSLHSFGTSMFEKIENDEVVTAKGPSLGNAWGDFNNDGYQDLYVCNYANYTNFLFKNNGNGSFSRMSEAVIEGDYADSFAASWGDYDNDGYLDLFVVNHKGTNILYHNEGGKKFKKLSTGSIVIDSTQAWDASWVDYNNDGYLDMFVVGNNKNILYKNLGNGGFERITEGAIVNDNNASFSCAWGDYNNDGYMDLFVANFGNQNNCLYKNLGNGKFEKILAGDIVNDGGQSRSASWGDYNNDGHVDLYVTNSGQTNFLYKNNGNGTFTKITNDPIVADENWSFSATWSDINNDSYLDMAVVNSTSTDSVSLFMNNKNGTFSKVSDPALFAENSSSWCISACDYDRNGTADLYVASRGFNPSYLYKNQDTTHHFIGVVLKGTTSNKSAIGATAEVTTANTKQKKYITANTGHGNQNGLQLLFGLGADIEVDTIKISWPSKTIQKVVLKAINQYYTIEECQPKQTTLQQAICSGDSLYFDNKYLKEAGSFARSFLLATGCDSTVTLNLSILPSYINSIDTTICDTCSYFAEGKWQKSAGIYNDTLQTVQGCDSIVTTNLKIEVTTGLPSLSSSDSYIYPNPTTGLVLITGINLDYYQLLDVTGKCLIQQSTYLIDLSSLKNGLYFLLLTDKSGRVTRKRIIKTL